MPVPFLNPPNFPIAIYHPFILSHPFRFSTYINVRKQKKKEKKKVTRIETVMKIIQ